MIVKPGVVAHVVMPALRRWRKKLEATLAAHWILVQPGHKSPHSKIKQKKMVLGVGGQYTEQLDINVWTKLESEKVRGLGLGAVLEREQGKRKKPEWSAIQRPVARASQAEGSARSQSEVKFHFRYRISRKVNLVIGRIWVWKARKGHIMTESCRLLKDFEQGGRKVCLVLRQDLTIYSDSWPRTP